jgi:ketosteroid isomerase-like protein
MTAAEHAVRETVQAWLEAVKGMDFESARELWDAEFEGLLYQPEEHSVPMTEWNAIQRYWGNVPALVERVPKWDEISSVVAVVDRVAVVFSRIRASIKIRDVAKTFDGEVRCSFGLRQADTGWRLFHYHESRLVAVEDVIADLTR